MTKKKILFMVTSMNIGGVEKSLLSLLSVIPKEKYDVTLMLLEKKGGFLEFVPEWVKVKECTWFKNVKPTIMQPPQKTIKMFLQKKQFYKVPPFIYAYVISTYINNRYLYYKYVMKDVPNHPEKYDVAISYQSPTDIIDYYVGHKVNSKKKISWVHFDVSQHLFNEKLYEKLYQSYANIYVVSSQAQEKLLEKVPSIKSKTEVSMNIVPNGLIEAMSREPIDFDEDYKGLKIVTVGRLSNEKGQDIAIKVLSRLLDEGYKVRWYCVGDGNSRKKYESLIKQYNLVNDFILLGAKVNPYPYMVNADIYVQTSRHESFCLTLAEAKLLQKPIITTNFIGAYEQIDDGKTGYIVDISEESVYKQLKYLIDNKNERTRLKENLSKQILSCVEPPKPLTFL